MTVIVPCQPCKGRGYIISPEGHREDCPRCSGRGYLASTEMTPEEERDWWSKSPDQQQQRGQSQMQGPSLPE